MLPLTVRDLVIGSGRTKLIVPLSAPSLPELLPLARAAAESGADAVEWRADGFAAVSDPLALENALCALREALGALPLLFTLRTAREGGAFSLGEAEYSRICAQAIRSRRIDLIDLEPSAFSAEEALSALIGEAHESGVAVVASRHDFQGTPPRETLLAVLYGLRDTGADLVKLAVMPRTEADVFALMEASSLACASLDCPVIAISMGALGMPSRVACRLSGSAMTFAALGSHASAPGQIELAALRRMIALLEAEE